MSPLVVVRRLGAACRRTLRHGAPGALSRPTVEVTHDELHDVLHKAFLVAGLPATWFITATSDELDLVSKAVALTAKSREADWQRIEAGAWPR